MPRERRCGVQDRVAAHWRAQREGSKGALWRGHGVQRARWDSESWGQGMGVWGRGAERRWVQPMHWDPLASSPLGAKSAAVPEEDRDHIYHPPDAALEEEGPVQIVALYAEAVSGPEEDRDHLYHG
uniref:Uncharacterized protein n=1 Tax=Chrysemys picta bellii TaxID=8478 RepID=A0A8C3HC31_CHRPI